jgi:hypothetical protein
MRLALTSPAFFGIDVVPAGMLNTIRIEVGDGEAAPTGSGFWHWVFIRISICPYIVGS